MANRRRKDPIDPNLVKALAHPLRVEILDVLNEREASPNQLKDLLGVSVQHASYHARVLLECDCIELTREEPRRGAVEHFYRALPESSFGHQLWRGVPRSLSGSVALASLKIFVGKLIAALKAGIIDNRDDTPLSSMTLALDGEGRADATAILQRTSAELKAVDEQSRKRSTQGEESLTPYTCGLALFKSAPLRGSEGG